MNNIKRKHLASFRAKVVLELIQDMETINQVCSHNSTYRVECVMVNFDDRNIDHMFPFPISSAYKVFINFYLDRQAITDEKVDTKRMEIRMSLKELRPGSNLFRIEFEPKCKYGVHVATANLAIK